MSASKPNQSNTLVAVPLDCADEIAERFGDVVSSTKSTSDVDDHTINKLVIKFESGAVLTLDGQFPARAYMEPAVKKEQELVGSKLTGLIYSKVGPEEPIKGANRYRQPYRIEFKTTDTVIAFDWVAIGSSDFDVDPRPRVSHRTAA
jgi:hypothetical protein